MKNMISAFSKIIITSVIIWCLTSVNCDDSINTTPSSSSSTVMEIPDFVEFEKNNLPCSAFDTINITDGVKHDNMSITHDGIMYSVEQYKNYSYIYRNYQYKRIVKEHIRGCICQHRICVKSCCPKGYVRVNGNKCTKKKNVTEFEFKLTIHHNSTAKNHNLHGHIEYGLTYGTPCLGYNLETGDEYKIERHGNDIKLNLENVLISSNEFCVTFDQDGTEMIHVCYPKDSNDNKDTRFERKLLPYC